MTQSSEKIAIAAMTATSSVPQFEEGFLTQKMSMQEMEEGVGYTKAKKRELRETTPGLGKTHIRECLLKAESSKDEDKAKGVRSK